MTFSSDVAMLWSISKFQTKQHKTDCTHFKTFKQTLKSIPNRCFTHRRSNILASNIIRCNTNRIPSSFRVSRCGNDTASNRVLQIKLVWLKRIDPGILDESEREMCNIFTKSTWKRTKDALRNEKKKNWKWKLFYLWSMFAIWMNTESVYTMANVFFLQW